MKGNESIVPKLDAIPAAKNKIEHEETFEIRQRRYP